jgi:hypothetical protein
MRNALAMTILGTIVTLSAGRPAAAATFNSVADCVVGKRVVTRDNHKGKITRIDRAWSYCYVLQDDTGKEISYLYSLLESEGSAAPSAANGKLIVGKYTCWVNNRGAVMGLQVLGPATYDSDGKKGAYRLEASGRIVFESGPFSQFQARLLSDRRVGINLTGGPYYNMTCDPPR